MTTTIERKPRSITSTLSDVLGYQNPDLVARLERKMEITKAEAAELFTDVKKFLYIAAISEKPLAPPARIDIGWHEFILFTKDYARFCQAHFGFFLHHQPTRLGAKSNATPAREFAEETFGELSENWRTTVVAEECAPESNCEAPPADCATN